jgi:glycosyltransferase involved in cell wall biosynthesis
MLVRSRIERRRKSSGTFPAQPGVSRTTNALVSVVVPVYNGERFLAEAIESSLAQDYRPIEVIVVDDGSNDRTGEIARSFEGVRYLFQNNQGLAAARNAGIAAARGEFIALLDADDLMLPNKLVAQAQYLSDHPKVGCVLCRQKILLEPGTPEPAWLKPDRVFGDPGGVPPGSALIRRSAIERGGGFDPAYRLAVGIEWLGRLRDAGVAIAVIPEALMLRRIHAANLTHQNRKLREELLQGLKGKIDRMRASKSARRGDS